MSRDNATLPKMFQWKRNVILLQIESNDVQRRRESRCFIGVCRMHLQLLHLMRTDTSEMFYLKTCQKLIIFYSTCMCDLG